MKSNIKRKIMILITLGIVLILFSIITTNLNSNMGDGEYNEDLTLDNENVRFLKVSGRIHIDNNWTDAWNAGICTGNGTYSDPYVIEDLEIDGRGWGSCILIENSDVYFKIENCTLYNSESGIKLYNVNNSQLINNTCSSNDQGIFLINSNNNIISGNTADYGYENGIFLDYSDSNNISGNTVNNNEVGGIYLEYSYNNSISGNTANNNNRYGIYLDASDRNDISRNTANSDEHGINLFASYNNNLSGNIMNKCGLYLFGSLELRSNDIDTTNLVNGKPLYYYKNEINLGPTDFLNAGQVTLINCNESLISNLNVSYCTLGPSLYYCNNNTISGNTANNNDIGIHLWSSDKNTVSGNTVDNNEWVGIQLGYSRNNRISGNNASYNYHTGIYLYHSANNIVVGNKPNNNYYGIGLLYSDNNIIYFNNLVDNHDNLYSDRASNILNSPVKIIYTYQGKNYTSYLGNYWDNYTGNDANNDGIGDTPFIINGEVDKYPLMEPIENYEIIEVLEPLEVSGERISGYNLFFLIGILSFVAFFINKKLKKN